MRKLPLLLTALVAAGILSGCGDPAPSTPLAPDQKPLDASKMSKDDVDKMLQKDHEANRQ